jgi:pyrroloquinoline quinone biosynthesis protein A
LFAAAANARVLAKCKISGDMEDEVMQECAVKENKSLTWTEPAYCDVRLGFEVTAYIYVR